MPNRRLVRIVGGHSTDPRIARCVRRYLDDAEMVLRGLALAAGAD
jgi:hypothetical protein